MNGPSNKHDILVIGGGPAGYVAAIRAAQHGLKVACVERERVGGICLNWGCIPTKALLRSAEVLELIKHASDFGIQVDNPRVDFEKVIARSRQVADKLASGIEFLFKKRKIEQIKGTARLVGRGRVEVQSGKEARGQVLEAAHILLATGARPRGLPNLEADGKNVITYREAMTLKDRPKSLLVIGAGAIGAEFASFYQAMGTQVTLVEALPQILPLEDEEIAKALERAFVKRGIKVMTSAKVSDAKAHGNGMSVTLDGKAQTFEKVLLSVGVRANTDGFGLEGMGVKLTERGFIQIDATYRTTSPGIYAIGDCAGPPLLAHKAMQEGIICVDHIAGKKTHALDYGAIPGCTYSSPEVASLGLTERAAKEKGLEVKIGRFPFSALGKALAIGESEGFVKVVLDARYGELVGLHMIGPHVTDLVIEGGILKTSEGTADEVLATPHAHPTIAEAIQEAVAHARGEAIHI